MLRRVLHAILGQSAPAPWDRSRTSRQLEASHPHNKDHESKFASTLSVAPAGNMGIKKRVKSLGEKLIPISPEFYDTERDEDLVAPKNVLLPFNMFLMCSQWIAFGAMMWYYASPVNNVRISTIQSDWNYKAPAYNCTPLMEDSVWNNRFSFDTCMSLALPPKASDPAADDDTVVWDAVKNGWKYIPYPHTTQAAVYHADTWVKKAGYSDSAAGLKARDEYKEALKKLNTCGSATYDTAQPDADGVTPPWVILKIQGVWIENPNPPANMDKSCPHANICIDYDTSTEQGSKDDLCRSRTCKRPTAETDKSTDCTSKCYGFPTQICGVYDNWNEYGDHYTSLASYSTSGNDWREVVDAAGPGSSYSQGCRYDHSPPLMENLAKLGSVTDWPDAMVNSADASKYPPSWGGAGGILAGYDRTKTIELCEITREEAVKMFALHRDSGYLCQYAKANAPFGCESSTPLPVSQCFSLAYANSLLMYTVFSAICVKIFFAAKKDDADDETPVESKEVKVVAP